MRFQSRAPVELLLSERGGQLWLDYTQTWRQVQHLQVRDGLYRWHDTQGGTYTRAGRFNRYLVCVWDIAVGPFKTTGIAASQVRRLLWLAASAGW